MFHRHVKSPIHLIHYLNLSLIVHALKYKSHLALFSLYYMKNNFLKIMFRQFLERCVNISVHIYIFSKPLPFSFKDYFENNHGNFFFTKRENALF